MVLYLGYSSCINAYYHAFGVSYRYVECKTMTTSRALEALNSLVELTDRKHTAKALAKIIEAALSAEEIEGGEIGPRNKCRETCVGCPALKTERWKDYLDNDDTDSGTKAVCTASGGTVISMYWNEDLPPEWCPAKAARQGRGG